jgi:hypothetical protein
MATVHALELLSAIIEKREAHGRASRLDVVTVLIRDLSAHRELINAAVRDAGGVLLDANDYAGGTEGTLDPTLKTIISTVLNVRRGGKQLKLNIEATGSTVHATLDGSRVDETSSPGLRTVSGIATALFDERLRETTFAAVTYDESRLEDHLADVAWELLTKQLDGVKVGKVRTLVVFVESPKVRYDRHCSQGTSLTFRLSEEGVEYRKSWNVNSRDISELRPSENSPLVLFLGAGFSASSRLPLGDTLRDEALMRHSDPSKSYAQMAEDFRQHTQENGRLLSGERGLSPTEFAGSLTLERVLREELYRHGPTGSPTLHNFKELNAEAVKLPGAAVRALHKLIQYGRSLVIVTVNFDTLIEHNGGVKTFVTDEEFESFPDYLGDYLADGGLVPLLKLHGTIEDPETVVATVDQTAEGLAVPKALALGKLLNPERPVPWVYTGYSMRDPDVTSLLGQAEFVRGADESWVSPFTIATAQNFVEKHRRYEGRRGFWQRSITETADEFMKELLRVW